MSFVKTIDFTNSDHWTFDADLVEIASDVLGLLLIGTGPNSYDLTNPMAEYNYFFGADSISAVSITQSATGSDVVGYIVSVNGVDKYWNGSAWATSDGTYSQSSTSAQLTSNIATLLGAATDYKIGLKIFLHSNNGTSTPSVTSIAFSYDYTDSDVEFIGNNLRGQKS